MRVAQLHRLGSVAVGRGAVADLCACWWHDALALTESVALSSLGGGAAVACCCLLLLLHPRDGITLPSACINPPCPGGGVAERVVAINDTRRAFSKRKNTHQLTAAMAPPAERAAIL